MKGYAIIEARPINMIVIVILIALLVIAAVAVGMLYSKSEFLEEELVVSRRDSAETRNMCRSEVDKLEKRAHSFQTAYVDLVVTGYWRIGPADMREMVQLANRIGDMTEGLEGVGGEDIQTKEKVLAKSRKGKGARQ